MSTSDLLTADQWLYSTLSGDATLSALVGGRIYNDGIPQQADQAFPCVDIRWLDHRDMQTMEATIFMNEPVYLVAGVDRADGQHGVVDLAVLEPIAARIQTLLHQQAGSVSRGLIYFCARERGHRARYTAGDGIEYRELGGQYRITTQS